MTGSLESECGKILMKIACSVDGKENHQAHQRVSELGLAFFSCFAVFKIIF